MAVFTTQFLSQMKTRKTIVLGIVTLLPVIGAILYTTSGGAAGLSVYKGLVSGVIITFLLPLLALFFGGPAVVEEVEGGTLVYLFLRPIAKPAIFLGKYLAATAMVCLLTIVPTAILFFILLAGDYGGNMQLLSQTLVSLLVGGLSYTAVFASVGAIFGKSLMGGIIYWAAVEWGLSFVPVLELATVKYHVRNAGSLIDPGSMGMLDKYVLEEPLDIPLGASYGMMLGVVVVFIVVGAWVFNSRQYRIGG